MLERIAPMVLIAAIFGLPAYGLQRPSPNAEDLELAKRKFSIRGNVTDAETLRPIGAVLVILRTTRGPSVRTDYADDRGTFTFERIGFGDYVLEVSKDGYKTAKEEIHLVFGAITTQRMLIMLQPEKSDSNASGTGAVTIDELQIPPKARKEFSRGLEELNDKNRPDESEDHFRKAIKAHPTYDEAYNQLALAHIYQAETETAEEVLKKALEANEENARAHMLVGVIRREQQRYKESALALRRGVELNPEDSLAQMELAKTLLELDENQAAGVHAERSHEMNPSPPDVHLVLFTVLVRQRLYDRALAELDEFLNKYPGNPRVSEIQEQRKQLVTFLAARKP